MLILERIINAGIGLAGFAGVIVALSGNPKSWSHAEKLRVGLMLVDLFVCVFGAFLYLLLDQFSGRDIAGKWSSILIGSVFILTAVAFMIKAAPVYQSSDETFNLAVGSTLVLITMAPAGAVFLNGLFEFTAFLPLLDLLLVWGLMLGAFLFLRILFHRPGAARH